MAIKGDALDNLLYGTALSDLVYGYGGNDTLHGDAGDDGLFGGPGADVLYGEADGDTLAGGLGNDTLDGGTGMDRLDGGGGSDTFGGALELGDTVIGGDGFDRVVDLDLSWATSQVAIDWDSLLNLWLSDGEHVLWIEDVEQFSGLSTGSADDVLRLGFVGDVFVTEYRGGGGTDLLTLDYSGMDGLGRSATGVTLGAPGADYAVLTVRLSDGGVAAPVRLYRDIEVREITGSAGNDSLAGGPRADTLRGGLGSDTLAGSGGADVLDGGDGADRLLGGPGDDQLTGGGGADYLGGGNGSDVAVYYFASAGVSVDLGVHAGTTGDALGDRLWFVEGIVGSTHADVLTGDDTDNWLYGANGADTLRGLAGNDFIHADSGPVFPATFPGQGLLTKDLSLFYGDDGNDTIWGATQVVSTADLSYFQPVELYGGEGDDDLYSGLLVDGGPGNDYVYGGAINSTIFGGDGADVIQATYGNHTVDGGAGDDFVWTEALHGGTNVVALGAGDDLGAVYSYDPANAHRFDGGDGIDEFFFSSTELSDTTPVEIDALGQLGGGVEHVGVIQVASFERLSLLLGGEHDDVLELGNLDDSAHAGEGDDYIFGRDGADFLDGHYGVDTVLGGLGNDVVIAGSSPAGVPENVRGGAGDDVVYGNFSSADWNGVARLYGNAGHDVFAFLPAPIYTADRVMDFVAGEDQIALYAGAYWYVDPAARSFESLSPSKVTDTADQLRFTFVGRFGEEDGHQIEVRYNKNTGVLNLRDASATLSEWKLVCTVAGKPDLHVGDFLTLAEVQAGFDAAGGVSGAPSSGWLGDEPAVGFLYYEYATGVVSAADSPAGMNVAQYPGPLADPPIS